MFSRTEKLLGKAAIETLKNSTVAVFGLGGVGGHTAEALARSGVGNLYLVDGDTVTVSNKNRQILALDSTVGRLKTDVAKRRFTDINPEISITANPLFFTEENADTIDFSKFDYCVDAIDTVSSKLILIKRCREAGVPIISSMGTANKLCPEALKIGDIYSTSVCPLARVMRRELKKMGVESQKVLYSTETPAEPKNDEPSLGSVSFVPSVAGLMIAGYVIKQLIK